MPIGKLDHYSIRTLDIDSSRRCYTEVIGLHQVFFEDPSQVTIELDFSAHEALRAA